MRCVACDKLLKKQYKYFTKSGEEKYSDLCYSCLSTIVDLKDQPDEDATVALSILQIKNKVN